MHCSHCQQVTSEYYRFCLHCGADLIPPTLPAFQYTPASKDSSGIKGPRWLSWFLIALIGASAVIVALSWRLMHQPQPVTNSMVPSGGPVSSSPQIAVTPTPPQPIENRSQVAPTRPMETPVSRSEPIPSDAPISSPRVDNLEKIYTGRDVTEKARILSKPEPVYTEIARQNQITGTVVLKAVFAANGTVTNIHVVSGLPFGLTERAIDAASRIRFAPATKDGQPVSMWIQLEYNFNLY
jgi:TonB family protein